MAQSKGLRTEALKPHRILREVYRHYLTFESLLSEDGRHRFLEHSYLVQNPEDGSFDKVTVEISFSDLKWGLKDLSKRKREAIFYNVILDKLQREVADIMDITTVSVGQYVEQGMLQLAKRYFAEQGHEIKIEEGKYDVYGQPTDANTNDRLHGDEIRSGRPDDLRALQPA